MAIKLTDSVGGDGVFDVQGRALAALESLHVQRLSVLPAYLQGFLTQFNTVPRGISLHNSLGNVSDAVLTWQQAGTSLAQTVRTALSNLLVAWSQDVEPQADSNLDTALGYLVAQMEAQGYYVTANTVSVAIEPQGAHYDDLAFGCTVRDGLGRDLQYCLAETVQVVVASVSSGVPTLSLTAPAAVSDALSESWPTGSGGRLSLTAGDAEGELLTNGSFDEDDPVENLPDGWSVVAADVPRTVSLSAPASFTVTLAGTPTAGTWLMRLTDRDGTVHATLPLAFDASEADVQAALREVPGCADAEVDTTGTNPDVVHAITLTGTAGQWSLAVVNHLTGGSITAATVYAGDPGAFRGRALKIEGNDAGSELTEVYHSLQLERETVYFLHWRLRKISTEYSSSSSTAASETSSSSSSTVASETSSSSSSTVASETSSSSSSTVASVTSSSSSSTVASETSSSSTAASETSTAAEETSGSSSSTAASETSSESSGADESSSSSSTGGDESSSSSSTEDCSVVADEIQRIYDIDNDTTGGTWTLTVVGQTSAPISANECDPATLETVINGLLGEGSCTTYGTGGSVYVRFAGSYAGLNIAQMTIDNGNITVGSGFACETLKPGGCCPTDCGVGDCDACDCNEADATPCGCECPEGDCACECPEGDCGCECPEGDCGCECPEGDCGCECPEGDCGEEC